DTDPFVPNTFIGSFRMEMHRFKDGTEVKDSPTNLHYWSSADMTLMRNVMAEQKKGQDMKILTDLKGKWQYMLTTDEKGKKTAMKSRKKKLVTSETQADAEKPDINVTSETRMIDGHLCKKVIVTSEDGVWTGWVAEDLPAPFTDMARQIKTADPAMNRRISAVKGMPLEFEWVDANGKDKMVCYMREVHAGSVDESVFSLDGYEVMEMPSYGQ
ncbi:MAG TPA: DUF4412 domain-containing protein, partial [Flavobacteriales bacterium]|nr:DUF4412 domain-containing protein [Flavobacteriales bacterium]